MSRYEHFLSTCAFHGVRAYVVLLDSCFGDDVPDDSWVTSGRYKNSTWTPNPGKGVVADRSQWPAVEEYVRAVVAPYRDDSRILAIDVMNEPDFNAPLTREFVLQFALLVTQLQPRAYITVGVAYSTQLPYVSQAVSLLSSHSYRPRSTFASDVTSLLSLGAKLRKPALFSECMGRSKQELCADVAPAVRQPSQPIGFIVWELMLGVDEFNHPTPAGPYQGLLHASNGSWWSEAEKDCWRRL